jgi:hypothetical protein
MGPGHIMVCADLGAHPDSSFYQKCGKTFCKPLKSESMKGNMSDKDRSALLNSKLYLMDLLIARV